MCTARAPNCSLIKKETGVYLVNRKNNWTEVVPQQSQTFTFCFNVLSNLRPPTEDSPVTIDVTDSIELAFVVYCFEISK